ncbi:hypothetical protein GGR52DRAFT_62567 [Hypoxylon sp. FL1284]|nr:hypothetical protein GGR52DRAFT_62567 [Hypoxylon sp. FL1284]
MHFVHLLATSFCFSALSLSSLYSLADHCDMYISTRANDCSRRNQFRVGIPCSLHSTTRVFLRARTLRINHQSCLCLLRQPKQKHSTYTWVVCIVQLAGLAFYDSPDTSLPCLHAYIAILAVGLEASHTTLWLAEEAVKPGCHKVPCGSIANQPGLGSQLPAALGAYHGKLVITAGLELKGQYWRKAAWAFSAAAYPTTV